MAPFSLEIRRMMAALLTRCAYTQGMKRLLAIGFTLLFLLISLIGTGPVWAAATGAGPLKVQSLDFFYKMEEEARFLELKNQWQSEHRGEFPMAQAKALAEQANRQDSLDAPLAYWRYHGGPAPFIFTAKAHLFYTGKQALLNVSIQVTVRARVGQYGVIPSLQLTDYQGLEATAHWETVSKRTITIPAIASGEDLLLPLMEFKLLDFLERHPKQFPVELEVRMSHPRFGSLVKSIPFSPDHFVMPAFY